MAIVRLQSNPDEGSEFNRLASRGQSVVQSFFNRADPFFSRVYPAINLTEEGIIFMSGQSFPVLTRRASTFLSLKEN